MSIDLNELAAAIGQLTLRFRVRRRTATDWVANNEVLLSAEIGLESDTGLFKFGDGVTHWNDLSYAGGGGSGVSLGPPNAGAGIQILNAAPFALLNAGSTITQAAATAAAGNKQVVWMKWGGYPTNDSDWAPANGTTFYLYASRRGTDDAGTGSVLCYAELAFSAGISYGPDDTTRYNIVGGASSGVHSGLVAAGVDKGVDIGGYHRSDNNLPLNACTDWSTAPPWANWAITLPLGEAGVFQPNPGDGHPIPGYGEWAIYAESLPGDASAEVGSARRYFEPTTEFVGLFADGFVKTVLADQAQISHVDFGRTMGEGLMLTVIVNATTYSYVLTAGQDTAAGLAGIEAVINADSSAVATASVSSGVLVLTGKLAGSSHGFTVTGSSKGRPLLIVNTGIRSVTAGANVTVDDTDPFNIIVSATGGGGSGGGGNVTVDVHPTTPDAMDDEFEAGTLDSKWVWANQNTASSTIAHGSLVVTGQATGSNLVNMLEQTLPSGDCSFIMKSAGILAGGSNYAGLTFHETSSGNLVSIGFYNNGAVYSIVTTGTLAGGLTSVIGSSTVAAVGGAVEPLYFKGQIASGNLILSRSYDGIAWDTISTSPFTSNFAVRPDKIGFGMRSSNSIPSVLSIDFFRRLS